MSLPRAYCYKIRRCPIQSAGLIELEAIMLTRSFHDLMIRSISNTEARGATQYRGYFSERLVAKYLVRQGETA